MSIESITDESRRIKPSLLEVIAQSLGFDPDQLRCLTLEPTEVTALVYALDDKGERQFSAMGEPALREVVVRVESRG